MALMVVGCSEGRIPVEARSSSPPEEDSANNNGLILKETGRSVGLAAVCRMGDVSDVFDGTTNAKTFTGPIRAETPRIRNEPLFMTDDGDVHVACSLYALIMTCLVGIDLGNEK